MRILCSLLIVLFWVPNVVTAASLGAKSPNAVMDELFYEASVKWGVPKTLLVAIANQESSLKPWCLNIAGKDVYGANRAEAVTLGEQALRAGKSFDTGLMQVNSYWLKKYNLRVKDIIDPRTNVLLGAWILAKEIKKYGLTWRAIANYHTPVQKNPKRGMEYARMVLSRMDKLIIQEEAETKESNARLSKEISKLLATQQEGKATDYAQ